MLLMYTRGDKMATEKITINGMTFDVELKGGRGGKNEYSIETKKAVVELAEKVGWAKALELGSKAYGYKLTSSMVKYPHSIADSWKKAVAAHK